MRFLSLCAAALIIALFFGQEAQAGRAGGVWGTSEQMTLITPTDIEDNNGQNLSLCHLTKKTHIMFAGVWRSSIGYVMAPNKCDSDSYYNMPADRLELGKALGDFPSDLSTQPKMSRADMVSGFWGLGAIAVLLILAGAKKAGQSKRTKERYAEMGIANPAALQAMDAMCHAAKADGSLDAVEIATMANIAQQMTGETFDESRIRRIYNMAEAKPTDAQFAAFGRGLTADQKRMVMQATLMIVGADGDLDKAETVFIHKLAKGLGISVDEVKAMFQNMAAQPA
ncbi:MULTISPECIES: TerB family tellurite resistance protein [unclassified Ruegeria]|uniref:tellurite resistance TerB family protein n=1 Tax=unclassified Ruegeria TaxID=2625375 RepID=UPI001487C5F5|nr:MULTISPECIES: TerB family tellurite resistance protein [unclassified Ruegeria]